jgi:hypothetical protein
VVAQEMVRVGAKVHIPLLLFPCEQITECFSHRFSFKKNFWLVVACRYDSAHAV